MTYLLGAALIIVGVIHLLPLVGVLGPARLQALYGITLTDPTLVLLMRHRAILFGLLGAFLVVAAFVPTLQLSALILGATSAMSFLVLARKGGPYNPRIADRRRGLDRRGRLGGGLRGLRAAAVKRLPLAAINTI